MNKCEKIQKDKDEENRMSRWLVIRHHTDPFMKRASQTEIRMEPETMTLTQMYFLEFLTMKAIQGQKTKYLQNCMKMGEKVAVTEGISQLSKLSMKNHDKN